MKPQFIEFETLIRHGKTGGSGRVRVMSIGLRVKRVAGQKQIILSSLKMGSSQSSCKSGQVDLTRIFHMIFFF